VRNDNLLVLVLREDDLAGARAGLHLPVVDVGVGV